MEKQPAVYILTNKPFGTLYIGVTSNLVGRLYQHQTGAIDGFSKKYRLTHLVYYEILGDMYSAISREKQLKRWRRVWKEELISKFNPQWISLDIGV